MAAPRVLRKAARLCRVKAVRVACGLKFWDVWCPFGAWDFYFEAKPKT